MAVSSIEITKDSTAFALHTKSSSYHFHIDPETKDLITDHYGAYTKAPWANPPYPVTYNGWSGPLSRTRREFPEVGRGDFRVPGWSVRYGEGEDGFVGRIKWEAGEVRGMKLDEEVNGGRGGLPGLKIEGREELVVKGKDEISGLEVEIHYSVLPEYDAITRSVFFKNASSSTIKIEKASSLCLDLAEEYLDLLALQGDWAREGRQFRRHVELGTTSYGSTAGYSSHMHNPSLGLVTPETSEEMGDCYGFALIYTGSFSVEVEKNSMGLTRVVMGQHERHTEEVLQPGESFRTPEAVAVFSQEGIGGMSRRFHKLFRRELCRSQFAEVVRPVLLNSWEGVYFDFDDQKMLSIAKDTAELGIKLLVMDDGWFGVKYPRLSDKTGLGDWTPNPERFPNGLEDLVNKVIDLDVKGGKQGEKLKFGIWVEPEMVSPKSKLYEDHPDWILHAKGHERTEIRDQLVLNLGLKEVQDYIIEMISKLLESGGITYIKWDNNRGMHEMASPASNRRYMEGLYHVLHTLTTKFPNVLFEGCASGGGRFDAGILQYFPQSWTSDDTDAIERLAIQFGTSLVYPASSMGAHVSAVPNHITGRTTPLLFRAHVAMMGGSFGFELDPSAFTAEEKKLIPEIVAKAEEVAPLVVKGEMYRLRRPEDTKFPAMMFVSEDKARAAVFCFQTGANVNDFWPFVKLRGLDPEARYKMEVNGEEVGGEVEGRTLMGVGVRFRYEGEFDSKLVMLTRV